GTEQRANSYAKAALILLTLSLFVSPHLVHYGMGLMALLGVVEAVRHPAALREWHARQLLLLFALLWLPMVIACANAVAPQHSLRTVVPYLHLLPAAYFVMRACADVDVQRLVTLGAAILLAFVALDAFVQLIWQQDLFGYPYDRKVLKGVFYPKQRLGLILAVFAPLYIDVVIRWCRVHPRLWLLLVPLVVVILMSLKRSAWIMLVFGLLAYVVLHMRLRQAPWSGRRVTQIVLLLVLAAGLAAVNPTLRTRLSDTSGLFSTDAQVIDAATAYRLTLWRTGARIFADHWPTGIGPRGFRHIYADYAAPDDFWIKRIGSGQTHPHQFMLEIAIESGVLGLASFTAFYVLLLRLLSRPTVAKVVPVWLLAAAVACLPLNAHLAFYGAYWSTLVWLLLAVGLA
ncbi:unnamed protein product, partial [Phaeothamnion confervicola]